MRSESHDQGRPPPRGCLCGACSHPFLDQGHHQTRLARSQAHSGGSEHDRGSAPTNQLSDPLEDTGYQASALVFDPKPTGLADDNLPASRICDHCREPEGRYLITKFELTADAGEITHRALRIVSIESIMRAAAPRCIALSLDDGPPNMTAYELTTTEGRILPTWLAEQVVKRGNRDERMEAIELLYGIAALSGNPPVQAIQQELGIPHRTASDWTKKARAEGRLAGMSYIVGRQADG